MSVYRPLTARVSTFMIRVNSSAKPVRFFSAMDVAGKTSAIAIT